jgi:hypothetical protein
MTALAILFCGIFDRMRGFHWRFMSFLYGLLMAFIFGITWKLSLVFALLWWLGAAPGWGEPLGSLFAGRFQKVSSREWWQVLGLQNPGNELWASLFRGAMWGACILPMSYWFPRLVFLPVITALGFVLAVPIGKFLGHILKKESWATMEFVRGLLMGLGIFIIS